MSGRSTSRDIYGWKRGLGAYSRDDNAFGRPRHTTDKLSVAKDREYSLIDNQADQPAGKWLGGGGEVGRNKYVGSAPPRFKYAKGTGPIGNLKKPK